MAKVPVEEFLTRIQQTFAEHWGYVYSAQGEQWSQTMAQKFVAMGRPHSLGSSAQDYFLNICKKWYGHRVADCSGLICWAIEDASGQSYDKNSQSLRNGFVKNGPIATIPDTPGLAVWKSGHIGVYIGGGYIIEARRTNDGVVKTKVAERDFTNWGELDAVDYTQITPQPVPPPPPSSPDELSKQYAEVNTASGRLNMRNGPSSGAAVIATLPKGTRVEILDDMPSWYQIRLEGYVVKSYMKTIDESQG